MAERRVEYQRVQRLKLVGVRVEAPSLQRVFLDSALAFFDVLSTGSRQAPTETIKHRIELSGSDAKNLFFSWMQKIRELYVGQKFMATRAVFEKFDGKTLVAVIHGEPYNSLHHGALYPVTDFNPNNCSLATDGPDERPFSAQCLWSV